MHIHLRHGLRRAAALAPWVLGAVLLGASLVMPVRAADLSVMPVVVQLDSARDRAVVTVRNQGRQPVLLQAEAVKWQRDAGVERPAEEDQRSADLIVNPPLFTLPPGGEQVVRLGLRRAVAAHAGAEATYRLVLREVPGPLEPGQLQGQVRVLVALRLPVYVAPARVKPGMRWQVTAAADGSVLAQVHNTGNVHLKVAGLQLRAATAQEAGTPLVPQGPDAVLLAGETRSWRLPASAELSAPTAVLISTNRGSTQVAVAPGR